VSADRTVHPDRWLENAPASYHEAGDLMDVVWQPRILIILFIPMTIAASGIRSIRPLRLEHQDQRRCLQHLASAVLHEPLGCFRFHLGQLVLHLLDEAGRPSVSVFESGDSTYNAKTNGICRCVDLWNRPADAVPARWSRSGLQR